MQSAIQQDEMRRRWSEPSERAHKAIGDPSAIERSAIGETQRLREERERTRAAFRPGDFRWQGSALGDHQSIAERMGLTSLADHRSIAERMGGPTPVSDALRAPRLDPAVYQTPPVAVSMPGKAEPQRLDQSLVGTSMLTQTSEEPEPVAGTVTAVCWWLHLGEVVGTIEIQREDGTRVIGYTNDLPGE